MCGNVSHRHIFVINNDIQGDMAVIRISMSLLVGNIGWLQLCVCVASDDDDCRGSYYISRPSFTTHGGAAPIE